jgi:tetratricopeptide (TPR) repeat protein
MREEVMKILFSHIATCRLSRMSQKSALLEEFQGRSFFKHALQRYQCAKAPEKIILLCPLEDVPVFQEQLKSCHLSNLGTGPSIHCHGLDNNAPYGFHPERIRYNPMRMHTEDAFGLWALDGLEAIGKQFDGDQILFWNMESFWYLEGKTIDRLFAMVQNHDFCLTPRHPEDRLVGMDFRRQSSRWSAVKKVQRQNVRQLQENFRTLTQNSLPDQAREIEAVRVPRLQDQMDAPPTVAHLLRSLLSLEDEKACRQMIQENEPGISLRYALGVHYYRQLNALSEEGKSINPENLLQIHDMPQVIHVHLFRDGQGIPFEALQKALQTWAVIPHWVFHADSLDHPELPRYLREAAEMISGHVYLETPAHDVDAAFLKTLFGTGLSVWVVNADTLLVPGQPVRRKGKLEVLIEQLRDFQTSLPDRQILIQVTDLPDHEDYIPALMHRWYGIVDGLVVRPAKNIERTYQVRHESMKCTIVPLELELRLSGKLALCSEMPDADLEPSDIGAWWQRAQEAGSFKECEACPRRFLYGHPMAQRYPPVFKEASFLSKVEGETMLNLGGNAMQAGDFEKALDYLERVLQKDPVNDQAWSLLTAIEKANLG